MKSESERAAYHRHLAEEHGDCLAEFIKEPAIREELCVQQALVAAYFARLYLAWHDAQTTEIPR